MTTQTHFDLPQLLRGTIGFDQIGEIIGQALNADGQDGSYPPYNIEKNGDEAYRVTLAVAGFSEDEIEVQQERTMLNISGKRAEPDGETTYLHRGISRRAFRRRFQLADHVKVTSARLMNGLLEIDLTREIPEASRPRTIPIGAKAA